MSNALEKYRDIGLLILRVGFGLTFFWYHGWAKISGGPERWAGIGGAMENFGIPFGHTFFGFMAAFTESVGALMFAAGLFFRPISMLLAFTMLVAAAQHIMSGNGTPAHALKNLFVTTGLAFVGPGKYSLDEIWRKKKVS